MERGSTYYTSPMKSKDERRPRINSDLEVAIIYHGAGGPVIFLAYKRTSLERLPVDERRQNQRMRLKERKE